MSVMNLFWTALSLGYFVHLRHKLHPLPVPAPPTEASPPGSPFSISAFCFSEEAAFGFFPPFSFSLSTFSLSVSLTFSLFYYIALYSPKYLLNKPSIPKTFLHGIFVCSLPTTMPHLPWDPTRVTSIINYNKEVQSIFISFKQLKMGKIKFKKDGSLLLITTVYWFRTANNENDQCGDISLNSPAVISTSLYGCSGQHLGGHFVI